MWLLNNFVHGLWYSDERYGLLASCLVMFYLIICMFEFSTTVFNYSKPSKCVYYRLQSILSHFVVNSTKKSLELFISLQIHQMATPLDSWVFLYMSQIQHLKQMEYCVIRTIFSPQKQYRQFLISPVLCMDSMLFITTKDSQDLCIHMVIPNTRLLIYVNLKYMVGFIILKHTM